MTLARLPMCAARIDRKHKDYVLLDAGCRTMALRSHLSGCKEYFGTDLIPSEGVLQCDLEKELPFEDGAFDVVTALDVLEHLDNPHAAVRELCRVARKAVYISLPNMFYITFRKNFLLGRGISGKYSFHADPVADRHRWVLSTEEAIRFVYHNAGEHTVTHELIVPQRGRTRMISSPIERWLSRKWPNLFAYGVLFEIEINPQAASRKTAA